MNRRGILVEAPPSVPTLHVLHVEDNPADAELVRLHLENAHVRFTLHLAGTLAQARQMLAPALSAILLDLDLPDSRGLDSLEAVRDLAPGLPVVVLTGRRERDLGLAALGMGAHDYLLKDSMSTSGIEASLTRALERARIQARFRPVAGMHLCVRRLGRWFTRRPAPTPGERTVLVCLRSGARARRQELDGEGIGADAVFVVGPPPADEVPRRGLGYIEADPAHLESLVLAVEEGCANLGPGCRVVVDDLEAWSAGHPDEMVRASLASLANRLHALGIPGEVWVAQSRAGRSLASRVAAGLEEAAAGGPA